MRKIRSVRNRASLLAISAIVAFVAIALATSALRADDLRTDSSLSWVPADAAFYTSLQRGEEQWDRISGSRAFKRVKRLFVVQAAISGVQSMLESNENIDGELQQARSIWGELKNLGIPQMLADGCGDEIFVHGSSAWADWAGLLMEMSTDMQRQQLEAIGQQEESIDGEMDKLMEEMIRQMAIDAAALDIPRLVIGMRLDDLAQANGIIDKAEIKFQEEFGDAPGIEVRRTNSQGTSFLDIAIQSDDLPWREWIREAESDQQQATFKTIRSMLEGKELHVTLGVHNGSLLLMVGPDLQAPEQLANGKLLIDIDEMKRVRSVADKPVTAVSYASHPFMQAVSRPGRSMDNVASSFQTLIGATDFDEDEPEMAQDLKNDVSEFIDDIKRWIPEPSTIVAVEWMTSDGYESTIQNWAENLMIDGSEVLDILDQAGKEPMMIVASRSKEVGAGYRLLSKWTSRGNDWVRRMIEKEDLDEEEQHALDVIMPMVTSFFQRFDSITKEALMPSLDGQTAVVMDDQLVSRNWIPALPDSHEELKLPEFAVVYRLRDGDQFEQAVDEYARWGRDFLQEVRDTVAKELEAAQARVKVDKDAEEQVEKLREAQSKLEEFSLPKITQGEFADGELHTIPIDESLVNEQIAPALAITDKTAVFSTSPATAERFATETSAPSEGLVAEHADQPLAAAYIFRPERLINLMREWSEYGFKTAVELTEKSEINMFRTQVDTILQAFGCCRRVESITFVDGPSLVTQTRSQFQDLDD